MNEYRVIARQYFRIFEGLHLYPGVRDPLLWLTVASLMAFGISLGHYFLVSIPANSAGNFGLVLCLFSEVATLAALQRVQVKKDHRVLLSVNLRHGTAFGSLQECKAHVLCRLLHTSRTRFLQTGEEVERLRTMEGRYRPRSETLRGEKWLFVYDPHAKDRLANWAVAFCSALLAVAVSGESKLDYVLDIATSPGFHALLFTFATVAILLFVIWFGVAVLARISWEIGRLWVCRVSRSTRAGGLELDYLCRDLIQLHRRPPMLAGGEDEVTS